MGYFRFQKRIGLGPFGRINLSKSGASLSVGVRGAHVTLGKTPRVTVGAPGTGLSYTETLPRGRRTTPSAPLRAPAPGSGWAVLAIVVGLLALLAIIGSH